MSGNVHLQIGRSFVELLFKVKHRTLGCADCGAVLHRIHLQLQVIVQECDHGRGRHIRVVPLHVHLVFQLGNLFFQTLDGLGLNNACFGQLNLQLLQLLLHLVQHRVTLALQSGDNLALGFFNTRALLFQTAQLVAGFAQVRFCNRSILRSADDFVVHGREVGDVVGDQAAGFF